MIDLAELLRISDFLEARSETSSARCIVDWCDAREISPEAILRYAHAMTRSTLETLAREEAASGCRAGRADVEAAIAAAIATAVQVGIDAERRRRDGAELPELSG